MINITFVDDISISGTTSPKNPPPFIDNVNALMAHTAIARKYSTIRSIPVDAFPCPIISSLQLYLTNGDSAKGNSIPKITFAKSIKSFRLSGYRIETMTLGKIATVGVCVFCVCVCERERERERERTILRQTDRSNIRT